MYCVGYDDDFGFSKVYEFFNKKENAVKRAKELFTECIYKDSWTGSIEKFNEEFADEYEEEPYEYFMKNFETGNYEDDWVSIEEIKTED